MGNSPSLHAERTPGRPIGIDEIALDDDGLMPRPGHGERSREASDAAPGDDDLHATKLFAAEARRKGPRGTATRAVGRLASDVARVSAAACCGLPLPHCFVEPLDGARSWAPRPARS